MTTAGPARRPPPRPSTIAPAAVATAPTTTAPTTTTAPPAAANATAIGRTYAVGTRTLTFVDGSRTTSPNGSFGGAPTRTLPTEVWYPADGPSGGAPTADAPPDATHGPYPLVLFAHGYDVTPDFYAPLLERWAAAGYVVAAPVFPILSGSDGGASHVDYEKTFGDASFVITQVLGLGGGDPLAGLVDRDRIAAAGHSDGEVVSFGLGFLACCRDPRVKVGHLDGGRPGQRRQPERPRHRYADPPHHGGERRVRPVPALDPVGPRQPHRAPLDGEPAAPATSRRTRSPAIPRSSS